MTENPKEHEDEHNTIDLTQQAGMVDPESSAEDDTEEESPRICQARDSTVQDASERPPGGHLPQAGEKTEGNDLHTSPKRPKKTKLEKQGDEHRSGRVVEYAPR